MTKQTTTDIDSFRNWLYFKLYRSWAKKYQTQANWDFFVNHMTVGQKRGYYSQFLKDKHQSNEKNNA